MAGLRWKPSFAYVLAVISILSYCSSRSDADLIVFTDRAAWEAAVGGVFTEEQFDDGITPGFTLAFIGSGHTATGQGISGGELHDRLDDGGTTTFTFDSPMMAFGGNWDLANPGGAGSGIQLFADAVAAPSEIPNSIAGTFWGVISTVPFTVITLVEGTDPLGAAETYDLDNVVFAPNVVPAPPALVMACIGGLGLVVTRFRRKPVVN